MRRALRIAGLLSVAAWGTLVGHAVTYLLEGRALADGRHGYFSPLLEIVFAATALSCVILVVRAMRASGDRRVRETPSLPVFWMILATLQVAGFAVLESIEGNAPDAFGWCVEVMIALVVAVAVTLFLGVVERCVAAIAATYHALARNHHSPIRLSATAPRPSLQLAACAGIHRFKRPPPIVIG
jgi:hypothetical protein